MRLFGIRGATGAENTKESVIRNVGQMFTELAEENNLKSEDNLAHKDISDAMKDECHNIYHMLTISALDRPVWDEEILKSIGFSEVNSDTGFADRMFSEKDEFYIPDKMFMISAVK